MDWMGYESAIRQVYDRWGNFNRKDMLNELEAIHLIAALTGRATGRGYCKVDVSDETYAEACRMLNLPVEED